MQFFIAAAELVISTGISVKEAKAEIKEDLETVETRIS